MIVVPGGPSECQETQIFGGPWLGEWGSLRCCNMKQKEAWAGNSSPKSETELSCDPAIPLLTVDPKDLKTETQTGARMPMFPAAGPTTSRKWKQPQGPSTVEWMNTGGPSVHWTR